MALTIRLLAFALAVYLQTATSSVEPGYTSLFDGKDLAGWRIGGPAESFTVQDGAIVARGITSHCYYDGSFRNHSFRNFELKVDVMTRPGSNGGVYVLTEFQEVGGRVRQTGRFPSKGFEIQVNNSHTDRIRTGSLYHVVDLLDESPAKLTPEIERFCRVILRGDKAAAVDTVIAVNIAQIAQASSRKIKVQAARDIQLTDLKTDDNIIFLGSPRSNPWSALFSDQLDFRFAFDKDSGQEIIRNAHPRANELQAYVPTAPGWATGQSFAVIAVVKNPDQNGHVLLLAGENREGTEAAGRLATDLSRLSGVLQKCGVTPSGPLQPFEILLHLNMMAGSPNNVDVVACHILQGAPVH